MIICRVCLDNSERLIPLNPDNVDALPIVHMLKEFTIINLEQQLPKYICDMCAGQLDIAYAFKRKYEDSIVKFVRQMSDQAEKEAVMISDSSCSSITTEEMPDIKPHEMHFNYSEMSSLTVDEKFTIEDMTKADVSAQSMSLNNLQPSNDIERVNSGESIDGTQHETATNFSASNENDVNCRSLPQVVLNKIYKYHRGRGTKPFKCDVCFRYFKTKGHIKTHRIRHIERAKRIKCSKCLLVFLTKPHFKKHRCSIELAPTRLI